MLKEILSVKDLLKEKGIDGTIVSAASITPMDESYIKNEFEKYDNIFVLEEAYEVNGFGSKILNYLNDINMNKKINKIGIEFGEIPHGKRGELMEKYGLRGQTLVDRIEGKLDVRG